MSRIRSVSFRPIATRGHSSITLTFTPQRLLYMTLDCNSHHPLHWRHTHSCLHWSRSHLRIISQSHTLYSLGLPLGGGRVLFSDCYSTERSQLLVCLVSFSRVWFLPVFSGFTLSLALWTLFASRLDYCSYTWIFSLPSPCWILFADRRPTLALRIALCLAPAIPVCCLLTLPVYYHVL